MRRVGRALLAGVAAAGVAVGVSVLVGASPLLIPTVALGAAVPVSLIYAVMTAEASG